MRGASRLLLAALVSAAATACAGLPIGGSPSTPSAPPGPKDFSLVMYHGEDVFGGKDVKFSQIFKQQKPVVLNFWGGQCPPCRAEMPEFQKVADDYAGQVIFVGVDVGPFTGLGSHDDAEKLLDELNIQYPTGYATDASPLQPYGVRVMPTTVYLSVDGKIVDTTNGIVREQQLRSEVQTLVGA